MKTIPTENHASWIIQDGTEKVEIEIIHECDELACHRLRAQGAVGEWAMWGEIAFIDYKGNRFAAVTRAHWPRVPEIFRVVEVKAFEPLLQPEDFGGYSDDLVHSEEDR